MAGSSTTSRDRQDGTGESGASRGSGGPSKGGNTGKSQPGDPSYEHLTRDPVAPGGGGVTIDRVGRDVPDGSTNFDPLRPGETLGDSNFGTPDQRAFNKRTHDFYNTGNGTLDTIGNMIARAFGFTEVNPMTEGMGSTLPGGANLSPDAGWQVDPIKAALQVGSFINPGIAVLNGLYSLAGYAGLQGPQIALDSGTGRPSAPTKTRGPSQEADGGGAAVLGLDKGFGVAKTAAQPKGAAPAQGQQSAPSFNALSLAAPFAALLDPTGRGRLPGQPLQPNPAV